MKNIIFFTCRTGLCLFVIVAGVISVESQSKVQNTSDWLKMEGNITGLNVSPFSHKVTINAKIKLAITNISDKPVFLYRQDFAINGDLLAISLDDAIIKKYAYSGVSGAGSNYGSPESQKIRKSLDSKLIPKEHFLIIEPSETIKIERETTFGLYETGIREDEKPWSEIKKKCETWLRVVIEVWSRAPLEKDGSYKFGKKLQKRWLKEGYLALDYLVSEPIKLILPDETGCK